MSSNSDKIAVIGMACRYPGAKNIDEYWQNLIDGKETIKHFSLEELKDSEVNFEELIKDKNFIPARGVLNDIDKFDANFFSYSKYDAELTDPQHRVWLETVWTAFENAGCNPFEEIRPIGVYAGGYINTYLLNNVLRDSFRLENFIRLRSAESFQVMAANDIGYLPTKTAYNFNLKGPAINIQTACSTSLVAIIQACQSLYSFESDICIAGGVCILTPQETGYIHQEGAIPSADGHCRPFDAESSGTVFSNGVGVVVLKRLEDAITDKDNIVAVVDGWALNNDGNKKISYTAPSVDGQKQVILAAQAFGDISADELGYIEAHGTATKLGDPIEIKALSEAFSKSTDKKQFCGIGSVKSNIGHTDAAAGVAGFIKACLIAKHKIIPPTLHFNQPNPFINFEQTPFYVVDKLKKWDEDRKLVVGVSSFGIGGTNAHIILEEPPVIEQIKNNETDAENTRYIIPLSAKSEYSLKERKKELVEFLQKNPTIDINDLTHTLWNGRCHFKYRSCAVVSCLDKITDINFYDNKISDKENALTFMFPGQGAQYINMGKQLYLQNNEFKQILDLGFKIYETETGNDIKEIIFPDKDIETATQKISETSITQPALFLIEYALAQTLISKGIKPNYLIGHSIGEYVAACISGIFDFETALKIVIKRGELMQKMPTGKMYAVFGSKEELEKISESIFEIAAENSPESCTISFDTENISQVNNILEKANIKYIPLNTSHAFHSKSFDPILNEFAEYVNNQQINIPRIQLISCLTGNFLTNNEAQSGEYWAKQLRHSVMFYKGIATIQDEENTAFIEVGPNTHLSSILKHIPEINNTRKILTTLGRPNETTKYAIEELVAKIWTYYQNYVPDLSFINKESKKINLPEYPFEKERYWIDYKVENQAINQQKNNQFSNNIDNKPINNQNTEARLLSIWKKILNNKDISVTDNFFDIGGNSLVAINLVDKVKREFQIDISLRIFFDAPTVQGYAENINKILKINQTGEEATSSKRKIISGEI